MAKYVYGIDLGTTYSCIAYQDETGQPTAVRNPGDDSSVTPSVVQWTKDGDVVVGEDAKDSSMIEPKRTALLFKRDMGTDNLAIEIDGRAISPIEASSFVLKKLVSIVKDALDDDVRDVVITCPAYFGETERTATKQAGELAGLNVLTIINEPTAAAIYYGVTRPGTEKTVLVYDLGGGTFDITIMKIGDNEIRVITTAGNKYLGGADWDDRIAHLMVDKYREEYRDKESGEFDADPFDVSDDDDEKRQDLQELMIRAERLKKQLTAKTSGKQTISFAGTREHVAVTREEFEEVTADLLEQTIQLTKDAIDEAKGHGVATIDEILLVGGSSFMPQVSRAIEENFPDIERKVLDPNIAVACGAATYAMMQAQGQSVIKENEVREQDDEGRDIARDIATGKTRVLPSIGELKSAPSAALPANTKIVSVSTKSYGVKFTDRNSGKEKIRNIIMKDDELPASHTDHFNPSEDNMTNVLLSVYEMPRRIPEYDYDDSCEQFYVGDATLFLPPNTTRNADIAVTLLFEEDGTLSLDAQNGETGGSIHNEFSIENGVMSGDELKTAKKRIANTSITA